MNKLRAIVREVVTFSEGAYDAATGKLQLTIIKPGFNTSKKRFYKESTLKRDHKIFEGAKMFVNHQTEGEQRTRPEGDINQWAANISRTWVENDGTVKGEAIVIDPPFKAKLATLAQNNLLHEMGVSIRAAGEQYADKIDGVSTNVVESFIACRSVDFVTYPGAGGRVELLESDRDDANDVDVVTAEMFEARRPDIVAAIKTKLTQELNIDMKTAEQLQQELTEANTKLTEANAKLATETTARTTAETKLQEAAVATAKANAKAELTKLLSESKLPVASQDRLRAQFKEAEKVEGIKEAIDAEIAYVKVLTGGKVTNLGEKDGDNGDDDKVNLVESFKSLGMTKEMAEVAAQGL